MTCKPVQPQDVGRLGTTPQSKRSKATHLRQLEEKYIKCQLFLCAIAAALDRLSPAD